MTNPRKASPPLLPGLRFVRWIVLGAVLLSVAVAVVLAWRAPSSPRPAPWNDQWTQTEWGPVSAADRDLLIKIRQACLWEGPTGQQAHQQARDPRVREIGMHIATEHAELDEQVRRVAAALGVELPSQPTDQQQVWMGEISSASGTAYDRLFVNRLRAAHGEVLPLVNGVRAGTRNAMIREFAAGAAVVIGRHMDYLESSGLVDYSMLPTSTASVARLFALGGYIVPVVAVLFAAAVIVTALLLRALRSPRAGPRRFPARWQGPTRAGRAPPEQRPRHLR
ncbi:MAG: DUF4142 domain-containing protein [Pseudonocardiaceae bacterium]|nr:DUF4142 domain-containing protein [Pseudonocardiaceae bacterium]